MTDPTIWMVRAGRGAIHIDDFLESEVVALGWPKAGATSTPLEKHEVKAKLHSAHPTESEATIGMWASQIARFYNEIQVGDFVTTYDPSRRLYFLGKVESAVKDRDHALGRARAVKWSSKISRDQLSTSTRNTLGSISSLFLITGTAAEEMLRYAVPIGSESTVADDEPDEGEFEGDDAARTREELIAKADEFVEDQMSALDWEQMQELVAGILRAMGYKTRVADRGPDRGVDIFASPDGLGLREPRVFVEVKHRPGTQIGANQIRSFLGGRQTGDRCLYVSTGGFSKEARYEAERASIPTTLITLPDLRKLLLDHYDRLDTATTTLVPLRRVYWPA